jgi:hypothetical protein
MDKYTHNPDNEQVIKDKVSIKALLDKEFKYDKAVKRSETLITIRETIFARKGDFSLIVGQPKAGKTTVSQFFIATALKQNTVDMDTLEIHSKYCEGKQVIYIDTEGSLEDTHDFVSGVLSIANLNTKPENFRIFRFREYTQAECKAALIELFDNLKDTHIWLIDGIADFVTSPNQETESNEMVRLLMKYANLLEACFLLVIHENPNGGQSVSKTRGHLGSELDRKAGGAIIIEKDKEKNCHYIKSKNIRKGSDFEIIGYAFENGKPFTLDLSDDQKQYAEQRDFLKNQELTDLRNKCFKGIDHRSERELKEELRFQTRPHKTEKAGKSLANRRYTAMKEKALIIIEDINGINICFPVNEKGERLKL